MIFDAVNVQISYFGLADPQNRKQNVFVLYGVVIVVVFLNFVAACFCNCNCEFISFNFVVLRQLLLEASVDLLVFFFHLYIAAIVISYFWLLKFLFMTVGTTLH